MLRLSLRERGSHEEDPTTNDNTLTAVITPASDFVATSDDVSVSKDHSDVSLAAQGVFAAFKNLSTREDRTDALHRILQDLTASEWRYLLHNARDFHCDIVAKLPLELLIQVFRYLDVTAPYRLQAVRRPQTGLVAFASATS